MGIQYAVYGYAVNHAVEVLTRIGLHQHLSQGRGTQLNQLHRNYSFLLPILSILKRKRGLDNCRGMRWNHVTIIPFFLSEGSLGLRADLSWERRKNCKLDVIDILNWIKFT